MIHRGQYKLSSASTVQVCQLWSAHVDALDRHLSSNMWTLAAITMVLISYPIARIVIPAILHAVVPDVVRTVLHFS